MKIANPKFLGITVNVSVPETAEEYDQLAGEVNACVQDANQQILMHSWGGKFRDKFAEALEKATEIEWPVNAEATAKAPKKKDGTVTPVHITPADYLKLVCGQLDKKPSDFQAIADEVAAKIAFDPSESERGAGRVSKTNTAAAEKLLEDPNRALAAVEKLQNENPGLSIEVNPETGLPTAIELAKALAIHKARIEKESLANLGL